MEIKLVPIENISDNGIADFKEKNIYLFNKLKLSIQRHGQLSILNVVPNPEGKYFIVTGREVLAALKELGVPNALCRECANYQEAIMIALEQESLRFPTDNFKIAEAIKELNVLGVNNQRLQHSIGWSKDELDNMIKMTEFDWEKFGEPDNDVQQISLF